MSASAAKRSLDKLGNGTDADNSCPLQNLELRPNLHVVVIHIRSVNEYDFGSNAMSWQDGGDRFANEKTPKYSPTSTRKCGRYFATT